MIKLNLNQIAYLLKLKRKDVALGVAKRTREYDIPLHQKMGSEFLTLLISLMTFLAILALMGSFILSSLTYHWTSGLDNELTIEIPAQTSDGDILSLQQVIEVSNKISQAVNNMPFIKQAQALPQSEIEALLSPWLGDNVDLQNIPLPGLVAVTIKSGIEADLDLLTKTVHAIADHAIINTHQKWLNDIVGFASALKFAAIFITLVIGFTTFSGVAGAMKSRIATHHDELELLHLMGASDGYITRQFQRHAFLLSIKGALWGCGFAGLIIAIIASISGSAQETILPDFSLNLWHYLGFLTLPIIISIIATLTARIVTMRALAIMP